MFLLILTTGCHRHIASRVIEDSDLKFYFGIYASQKVGLVLT